MTRERKKPTMIDVARLAGVSQTTVSFIVSGRPDGDARISAETRARVNQAIAQLGYTPNQAARSLRRQRTERIALFIDRLGAPYFESLAQALQAAAEARGYALILLMGKSDAQQRRVVQSLHQGLVDGVFFTSLNAIDESDLARLARAGLAVVVYDNSLQAEGIDVVRYDGPGITQAAVDLLARKGHTRIDFLGFQNAGSQDDGDDGDRGGGNRDGGDRDGRSDGYLAGMARRGLEPRIIRVDFADGLSRQRIYECAAALLRRPDRPTAVVCSSDIAAICAIAAAKDMGLRIPQDLAVIGSGNIPESSFVRPSLSTVGPNPLDFSPAAAMLFSRLAGEAPAEGRTWTMEWTLIERQTT